MNNKSQKLFIFLIALVGFITIEILYINNIKYLSKQDLEIKSNLVSIVGLPDLSISTEAMYIRHRTLSSSFEIFKDDPELLTYFPSTFVISPSNFNNNISRIQTDD
ncbi:MAG: hypothetical protein KAJ49_00735 [Arcobacteraceae bacterium]|nr:hypothetical protein [Arcobacteraceae bacterium]